MNGGTDARLRGSPGQARTDDPPCATATAMQALPLFARRSRRLVVLLAAACAVALGACSHTLPRDPAGTGTATQTEDPWRVRGSVQAGPMLGTPAGPYGARP